MKVNEKEQIGSKKEGFDGWIEVLVIMVVTIMALPLMSGLGDSQFRTEPVLIKNVDNYCVRGNREFNGTSYTTSYVLSYEADGKIVEELEIGDLYINYNSNKSEILIYRPTDSAINRMIHTKPKVVVYTNKPDSKSELKAVSFFNKTRAH